MGAEKASGTPGSTVPTQRRGVAAGVARQRCGSCVCAFPPRGGAGWALTCRWVRSLAAVSLPRLGSEAPLSAGFEPTATCEAPASALGLGAGSAPYRPRLRARERPLVTPARRLLCAPTPGWRWGSRGRGPPGFSAAAPLPWGRPPLSDRPPYPGQAVATVTCILHPETPLPHTRLCFRGPTPPSSVHSVCPAFPSLALTYACLLPRVLELGLGLDTAFLNTLGNLGL